MSLPADPPPFASPTPAVKDAAPPSPVSFPLAWILEHGSPGVRFRALVEVGRIATPPASLWAGPYAEPMALRLALSQHPDGTWGTTMLAVPSAEKPQRVGTVSAVRRLLESGWDRDSPPLARSRRLLFRLLAEDDDPAFLFDFAKSQGDEGLAHRGRIILREAAAATLAQAGYEGDPRLRGAARRIVDRIGVYLRSPVSQKPWVRVGNKQVLAAEATPPSLFALIMLAYMPLFRSEHFDTVERMFVYLSGSLPRQVSAQLIGDLVVPQPHLVLGDPLPHRNAVDADVPFAIMWLEVMARLGFLRRHEGWLKLYDRFLDDCDRAGVWHPHKANQPPTTDNPFVWSYFPVSGGDGPAMQAEVTFRLGLIGRLLGRTIELV